MNRLISGGKQDGTNLGFGQAALAVGYKQEMHGKKCHGSEGRSYAIQEKRSRRILCSREIGDSIESFTETYDCQYDSLLKVLPVGFVANERIFQLTAANVITQLVEA